MPNTVCENAMIRCSFGMAPSTLGVTSQMTSNENGRVATVMDFSPANLKNFGMCTCPANPAVAAALGAPQPCMPVPTGPWKPGNLKVKIGPHAALQSSDMLMCAYGGVITIIPTTPPKVNM